MLYPTINQLTKNEFNRYELAIATAKCARIITGEYVKQREQAEASMTGNKETDRSITSMIDRELRDETAVKVAINRINRGEFCICENAEEITLDDENTAEVDGVEYVLVDDEA